MRITRLRVLRIFVLLLRSAAPAIGLACVLGRGVSAQSAGWGYGEQLLSTASEPHTAPADDLWAPPTGPYYLGTHMTVNVDYMDVGSARQTQMIVIAQQIAMSDGTGVDSGPSDLHLVGGLWNSGPSEAHGVKAYTYFDSFLCLYYNRGFHECSFGPHSWLAREAQVSMALRMTYRDACSFAHPGCPAPSKVNWELVYSWLPYRDDYALNYYKKPPGDTRLAPVQGTNLYFRTSSFWRRQAVDQQYPITIRKASHGLFSHDTGSPNQVHLHTHDHSYYRTYRGSHPQTLSCAPYECGANGKDWNESPGNIVPWPEYSPWAVGGPTVHDSHRSGDRGVSFDVCMNRPPGWPCSYCANTVGWSAPNCQERKRWCWATALQYLIWNMTAATPQQCEIVARKLELYGTPTPTGTPCPNEGAWADEVTTVMISYGLAPTQIPPTGPEATEPEIVAEIDAGRPVMFSGEWDCGRSDCTKHTFLIYGYDCEDVAGRFFHIWVPNDCPDMAESERRSYRGIFENDRWVVGQMWFVHK